MLGGSLPLQGEHRERQDRLQHLRGEAAAVRHGPGRGRPLAAFGRLADHPGQHEAEQVSSTLIRMILTDLLFVAVHQIIIIEGYFLGVT